MVAINMARKPLLLSLWMGFAHSAISKVSPKDCETLIVKLHWEMSNFQLYKRLEINGDTLTLGQIFLFIGSLSFITGQTINLHS